MIGCSIDLRRVVAAIRGFQQRPSGRTGGTSPHSSLRFSTHARLSWSMSSEQSTRSPAPGFCCAAPWMAPNLVWYDQRSVRVPFVQSGSFLGSFSLVDIKAPLYPPISRPSIPSASSPSSWLNTTRKQLAMQLQKILSIPQRHACPQDAMRPLESQPSSRPWPKHPTPFVSCACSIFNNGSSSLLPLSPGLGMPLTSSRFP